MMFRKKDFMLITMIIVIAVVSSLLAAPAQRDAGATVRITIDGVLYGEYSLSGEQSISRDEELGYTRIEIEDGSVYMAGADCPDKYCMDYKPIAKGGEMIICLPHKLVVEVTGIRDTQRPDVVVP